MLNIGGDDSDLSYRYKMPKLKAKIEGRGNGIRTVIPNMAEVAKALNCAPAFPTKFFGVELGAQSKWDKKTERASVNGAHNAPDLQKMMTKFVSMFILCPRCGLPEIKWNVTKTQIKIDCAACGYNGSLNTQHRLVTYILKEKNIGKKKGKSSKKDRREGKRGKKGQGAESSTSKRTKEPEEVVWFTDTSKDAVDERKKREFELMTEGRGNVSTISSKESPVLVLRDFVKTKNPTVDEIIHELDRLKLARGFTQTEKVKILLESTIDTKVPKSVPGQFEKKADMLKKVITNDQTATLMILCIEELVGVVEKKLLPRIPLILQKLYDTDTLEEDIILKWADSPPETSLVSRDIAVSVRKAAAPFVNWLKEAEESDDE